MKPYAKKRIKKYARRQARRLAKIGEHPVAIREATDVTYLLR